MACGTTASGVRRPMRPSAPFLPAIALALTAAGAVARPRVPSGDELVERRVTMMGTSLDLRVTHATRAEALAASEACVRALEAVEQRLSTWRDDSELARLNASPVGEPFELSRELADDLALARRWWEATGGAFDPGVGALVRAWDLRGGGRRPAPEELAQALAPGGMAALELDGRRAVRRHPALVIEEGAFGKGIGLDAGLAAARERGAHRVRLDLGGQLQVWPADEPLRFGIAYPDDRARVLLELTRSGGSLATSGNSERAIVVDGERRSHLLDPRSGRPAPDFGSVTVWARDAASADCLSTALYVMGPDAGLAWLARRGDEPIEAVFIETRRGALRVRATAGLEGDLRASEPGVVIEFVRGPSEEEGERWDSK